MSLIDLLPTTKLGHKIGQLNLFKLGADSTLHYHSSLDGSPAFSGYKDPYLRGLKPTRLAPPVNPKKYSDKTFK